MLFIVKLRFNDRIRLFETWFSAYIALFELDIVYDKYKGIAWCDTSGNDDPSHKFYSDEQLTKCAILF